LDERGSDLRLPFDLRTDREGDNLLIGLFGELDASAREPLNRVFAEIEADGIRSVMVDLSAVTFIDSAGLLFLMSIWRRCQAYGISVVFEGASERAQALLATTGMSDLPPIFPGSAPAGANAPRSGLGAADRAHHAPSPDSRPGLPSSFIPGAVRRRFGR
jgi:anti-sigma B factor antagonist